MFTFFHAESRSKMRILRMLVRFRVSNFLSFDTPVEFSMVAGKESQHAGRVFESDESAPKILQVAVVYGANASGKSNLCKALAFLRNFLVVGTRADGSISRAPFKLRTMAPNEPSEFEMDFVVWDGEEEKVLRYRLLVTSKEVLAESLYELRPSSERRLFNRQALGGDSGYTFDWCEKRGTTEEDRQFAKFVARGTRRNQAFVSEAAYRNIRLFRPVIEWFRDQLVILEPNAEYLSLETLNEHRQELREYVADLLGGANTGIVAIDSEPVPIESTGLPASFREQLISQLQDGGPGMLLRSTYGQRFSIFLLHGELKAAKVRLYRKSSDSDVRVAFDVSEESDGTMRLFDLSPLFHELVVKHSRKTFIVDELDRSLHTSLTKELLNYFLRSCSKKSRSQLITTVHDIELLDQKVFRRDEIWFTTRLTSGNSGLTRLSESKNLRYDKDLRRGYLQGEFGDIPSLDLKHEVSQPELF